jgi:Domain of unknown function (DUF4249)
MRKLWLLPLAFALFSSCIDRLNIKVLDSNASQLVVDGLITNEPGPYTVKLSLSSTVDGFLDFRSLVSAKRVTIFDDLGNTEDLTEKEKGTYQTKPNGIRGVAGRSYGVRIAMEDGKSYESVPDLMNPVGNIDNLYYTLDAFQPLDAPTQYGFRVFVDANGVPDTDNLYRWKFTGTYVINTNPELKKTPYPLCTPIPRACSGFVLSPIGVLQRVGECTCCVCWVNEFEDKPFVSDNLFIANGKFKNIEVAYVPVSYWPFQIKYRVEVKQMSLSRMAFDYWKIVQSQKEGGTSLFQPPTGKTRTNIFEKNGMSQVQGIFYASAVTLRQTYITNDNVKELFLRIPQSNDCETDKTLFTESCLLQFRHSSNKPPPDWK